MTNTSGYYLSKKVLIRTKKQVKTWDSKSAAICTGLAFLSAITKTSEGPAGMSIEIIASLFCEEIGTEGRIKSSRGKCVSTTFFDWNKLMYKF